jgi:hypothetical protein
VCRWYGSGRNAVESFEKAILIGLMYVKYDARYSSCVFFLAIILVTYFLNGSPSITTSRSQGAAAWRRWPTGYRPCRRAILVFPCFQPERPIARGSILRLHECDIKMRLNMGRKLAQAMPPVRIWPGVPTAARHLVDLGNAHTEQRGHLVGPKVTVNWPERAPSNLVNKPDCASKRIPMSGQRIQNHLEENLYNLAYSTPEFSSIMERLIQFLALAKGDLLIARGDTDTPRKIIDSLQATTILNDLTILSSPHVSNVIYP